MWKELSNVERKCCTRESDHMCVQLLPCMYSKWHLQGDRRDASFNKLVYIDSSHCTDIIMTGFSPNSLDDPLQMPTFGILHNL